MLRCRWPDGRKVIREARRYRHYFPEGACSWCERALEGHGTIDHDHRCCNLPSGKCCAECVRGRVHLSCNQEIARIEWLVARGYKIELTEHQANYLTTPLFSGR